MALTPGPAWLACGCCSGASEIFLTWASTPDAAGLAAVAPGAACSES